MSIGSRLEEALTVKPFRYQVRGVRFIERHDGRVLLGDDMGVGKTLQAAGWLAINPDARPAVIICPASVKYNWQRELRTKCKLSSMVCEGMMPSDEQLDYSLRKRIKALKKKLKGEPFVTKHKAILAAKRARARKGEALRKKRKAARRASILIINYKLVPDWLDFLVDEIKPRVLIMDECHYVKNRQADRTEACTALARISDAVMGLSGTPISGKPIEFYPILNMIRPREFPSYWKFGMEYGAPKRNRWSGGYDFNGASNLEALHIRLKDIMIRRMKKDVLRDLPRKLRTVTPIDITNRKEYDAAEENFLDWLAQNKGAEAVQRAKPAEALVKLGQLKQLAALGKLEWAVQWVNDWLENTDEKMLLFGYHKPIMQALREAWPDAACPFGAGGAKARHREVERFRDDPACRLFLGRRTAEGAGIDGLQVASNVLFMEIGWTPGEHDQAEDRALRIGQTQTVHVHYLVGRDTVEERILEIIEEKDDVVSAVLDGKAEGQMQLLRQFLKAR